MECCDSEPIRRCRFYIIEGQFSISDLTFLARKPRNYVHRLDNSRTDPIVAPADSRFPYGWLHGQVDVEVAVSSSPCASRKAWPHKQDYSWSCDHLDRFPSGGRECAGHSSRIPAAPALLFAKGHYSPVRRKVHPFADGFCGNSRRHSLVSEKRRCPPAESNHAHSNRTDSRGYGVSRSRWGRCRPSIALLSQLS